jgi:hypothetical protein
MYGALDFQTCRHLGRWQIFESVSRNTLSATAVAGLGTERVIQRDARSVLSFCDCDLSGCVRSRAVCFVGI